jgi:beta-ureidopropionase
VQRKGGEIITKRGYISVLMLGITLLTSHSNVAADDRGPNPIIRVVTISQAGLRHETGRDLLEPTLARLDASAVFHPDIACLPELFSNRAPEPVPGPVTERLSAWARANSSYVLFGLRTKKGDRIYNSAILLDRQGQIIGQYHKIHPTEDDIKNGTTPGPDVGPPVFKTDFGTIGIQICFDVNWREEWQRLKQQGAQIIFFPSAYPAARQLAALAVTNEIYIVSSTMQGPSSIYDITGEVLASTGSYQEWVGTSLPLGKRLFETDDNAERVPAIQSDYGSRVQVVWYHDSSWVTIASLDPQLTVEDLITKYGLIPLRQYIAQSTRTINEARAKARNDPPPGH